MGALTERRLAVRREDVTIARTTHRWTRLGLLRWEVTAEPIEPAPWGNVPCQLAISGRWKPRMRWAMNRWQRTYRYPTP